MIPQLSATTLPGFRRKFRVTPIVGKVCAEVEDDFHCMSVIVHHDGESVLAVEPNMRRAPWTTCPGAEKKLQQTFSGVALKEFSRQGEKKLNCTHLYDLALLAAVHAGDEAAFTYEIYVSDPVEGYRKAEIYQRGEFVLGWTTTGMEIVAPDTLSGVGLASMRECIANMPAELQEPAKLLQWANMIANGRLIPMSEQSDASRMPASCYTFQPERAIVADRVGEIKEFSTGGVMPLDGYEAFQ